MLEPLIEMEQEGLVVSDAERRWHLTLPAEQRFGDARRGLARLTVDGRVQDGRDISLDRGGSVN
jgi:hypothetical protein